jgi:transcription termination factor NusB
LIGVIVVRTVNDMEWFDNVRKNALNERLYEIAMRNKAKLDEMLDEHYEFVESEVKRLVSMGISEKNARKLVADMSEETRKVILDGIEENKKNLERFISSQVIEE